MVDLEERPKPVEYTVGISVILLANRGEVWFLKRENPNNPYLTFRQMRYIDW